MGINLEQPILQSFGRKITQGPLVIAKRELNISLLTFQSRVTDIVFKIASLYWELIFQTENLVVQENSLDLAQKFLLLNQTKVRLGLLAPIEILVAENSVASREEAVIIAEKGVLDLEDQIGNLIGLWGDAHGPSGSISPTDRPVSEESRHSPDDVLESALKNRPEIAVEQDHIENSATRVMLAQDNLRPSLDFRGGGRISGDGEQFFDSFGQMMSRDSFYSWDAGLFFSVPIGNKIEIATVRREKAAQQKSRIVKEKLIAQITLDVREGSRRVTSDFKRIKVTRRALALAKKQLSAGEERFQLGLLASHDIIRFQNDVTIAEGHALRAIIDYNKSLENLYRLDGSILEKYEVKIAQKVG